MPAKFIHGSTHGPDGSDPIPSGSLLPAAYIVRTTNLTVPDSTPTAVDAYDSGAASGSLGIDLVNGLVTIGETGLYAVYASAVYTTTWASGVQQVRVRAANQTQASPPDTAGTENSYNSNGPTAQVFDLAVVTALGSPNNGWAVTLDQVSGLSRTADTVVLRVVRLADLPI